MDLLSEVFEGKQLFVRRAVVFEPIATAPLAVGGHLQGCKPTGTMVVQIGVAIGRVETLGLGSMLGGDRFGSDMLAHHRAVFALHHSVVGGAMRPRFGELLHQQLVQ